MIYKEFSPQPAPALKHTTSLGSLITTYERDPAFAARLKDARRELAKQAFRHPQQTLRGLRLSVGLSQTQLAEKIGTVQSHIARIELGQNDPGTELIVRLAVALGVKPGVVFNAVLMGRDEKSNKNGTE